MDIPQPSAYNLHPLWFWIWAFVGFLYLFESRIKGIARINRIKLPLVGLDVVNGFITAVEFIPPLIGVFLVVLNHGLMGLTGLFCHLIVRYDAICDTSGVNLSSIT